MRQTVSEGLCVVLLVALLVVSVVAAAADEEYDLVVYGATPAGIGAALSLARLTQQKAKILIAEPTKYDSGERERERQRQRDRETERERKAQFDCGFLSSADEFTQRERGREREREKEGNSVIYKGITQKRKKA
jgi:malic enzyme